MSRRFAMGAGLLLCLAALAVKATHRGSDRTLPLTDIKAPAPFVGPIRSPSHVISDWQPLFNGRDLTGWRHVGGGRSLVQDGVLVLSHDADRKPGYLVSTMTAHNFRVKLRCQVPTGDSGFYFHASFDRHTPTEVLGLQVQLNLQPGCGLGGLYEPQGRGWLVKPSFNREQARRDGTLDVGSRPNDWLDCDIEERDRHIRVTIDGTPTVDFTDSDPDNRYQEAGFFALQIHGGGFCDARFQTILVQPLD